MSCDDSFCALMDMTKSQNRMENGLANGFVEFH